LPSAHPTALICECVILGRWTQRRTTRRHLPHPHQSCAVVHHSQPPAEYLKSSTPPIHTSCKCCYASRKKRGTGSRQLPSFPPLFARAGRLQTRPGRTSTTMSKATIPQGLCWGVHLAASAMADREEEHAVSAVTAGPLSPKV